MGAELNAGVRGLSQGMRAKDLRFFMMAARQHNVIILVRHTNDDSLKYVGKAGFYPKPAVVKAKTADINPPPVTRLVNGLWGVERQATNAPRWSWRVDVDPASQHFGCLQLKTGDMPWSYVHGDYDLKDVIVTGMEQDNRRLEGTIDSVKNFTPKLHGMEFETIQRTINSLIGIEMVQHGAEAQFAWHGDEPITVAYPDWTFLILASAETVQSWYRDLNREILAKKGHDYLADASRAFHFGPQGMFKPGCRPQDSWGS